MHISWCECSLNVGVNVSVFFYSLSLCLWELMGISRQGESLKPFLSPIGLRFSDWSAFMSLEKMCGEKGGLAVEGEKAQIFYRSKTQRYEKAWH